MKHFYYEFVEDDGRRHVLLLPEDSEKNGQQVRGDDGMLYSVRRISDQHWHETVKH